MTSDASGYVSFPSLLVRALRRGAAWVALFLFPVTLVRCLGERPPRAPAVGGPSAGQPGDTLRFWAWSTDPNGGDVSYLFDWGDGSSQTWTAELASGDTFFRNHLYPETSEYAVRVRARDKGGLESDWSRSFQVKIALAGPYVVGRPEGPAAVYVDTASWFSAVAADIHGDSVSVRFDWGDTLGSWSGFAAPGQAVSDSHTFRSVGTFLVRARARDRSGNQSPWSSPETVVVSRWPVESPRNITIRATQGTNLKLRWDTGRNSDSVVYRLWFQPLGSGFVLADSTWGVSIVNDPIGSTGLYTVSARLGAAEVFASETLSIVPVYTDTALLYELNAGDAAGYGWDSLTGLARRYSMEDTGNAGLVDAYFTDLAPGSTGPGYFLASPHLGPTDPGGQVPAGPWRRTSLAPVYGSPQQPLPEYDSLVYSDFVDVTVPGSHNAVYTQDGCYALVEGLGVDPRSGTIRVLSWFQKIRGLRLIQHPEQAERGRRPGSP